VTPPCRRFPLLRLVCDGRRGFGVAGALVFWRRAYFGVVGRRAPFGWRLLLFRLRGFFGVSPIFLLQGVGRFPRYRVLPALMRGASGWRINGSGGPWRRETLWLFGSALFDRFGRRRDMRAVWSMFDGRTLWHIGPLGPGFRSGADDGDCQLHRLSASVVRSSDRGNDARRTMTFGPRPDGRGMCRGSSVKDGL
jgi:hypothetical protein